MLALFGFISGLLTIASFIPYLRDIFRLKTKPERASWLIWSITSGIAFTSQLAKGATYSLWLPGVDIVGLILVFFLSIRYGVGGFTKRDVIALIFVIAGLIIWSVTKEAAYALYIIICIDAIGSLLTAYKGFEDPQSETMLTWILASAAGLFALFAVGSMNMVLLSYPLYIFIANLLIVTAIFFGKTKVKHTRS
jgi:hypothetical protein